MRPPIFQISELPVPPRSVAPCHPPPASVHGVTPDSRDRGAAKRRAAQMYRACGGGGQHVELHEPALEAVRADAVACVGLMSPQVLRRFRSWQTNCLAAT